MVVKQGQIRTSARPFVNGHYRVAGLLPAGADPVPPPTAIAPLRSCSRLCKGYPNDPAVQRKGTTMISFRDFVPEVTDKGGLFKPPTLEQLSGGLARANDWVASNKVRVLNIETVVLPNIHSPGEAGSGDSQLHTSGEMHAF
jgi:hypothetical protein